MTRTRHGACSGQQEVQIPMSRPFSVLLVEDDEPLRCVLTEYLLSHGWVVRSTGVGQEAIQWARRTSFDFSILDLHLPGMSGLDVLRAISRKGRPMPSIMMSGQASREEATAALREGVFKFLRKPLELDKLRLSVDRLIKLHFGAAP